MSEHPLNRDDVARDPALDRAYRAAAGEEPPARLDDAIRAAARREVGARPQPAGGAGLRRWRVPVSIAAMVVVGASVVTLMREEQPALLESPANKVQPAASAPAAPADIALAQDKLQSGMANAPASAKVKADGSGTSASGAGRQPGQEQAYLESAAGKDAAAKKRAVPDSPPAPANEGGILGRTAPAAREEAPRADAQRDARAPATAPAPAANVAGRVQEPERSSPRAFEAPEPRPAEAPAAAPRPAGPPPMAEAKVASKVEAPVAADAQMRQRSTEGSATADSIAQAAPKPAPAPSPPAAKPAPRPPAREMQPSAPASEAAVAPLQKSAADADYGGLDTPEKWVARLRDLRKQGRLEEANRAYAEFRKRYPQYVLPADLQEGFRP